MSRPLQANPKRKSEADLFHREVFKAHGVFCYFCGRRATDAMHIVNRAFLGPKRYACPIENGRPGCRKCHDLQTDGTLKFKIADRRRAVKALNAVLKDPLPLP